MERVRKDGKLRLRAIQYKDSIDCIPANMDESVQMIGILMKKMRIQNCSPAGKSVPQIRQEIKECSEAEENMDDLVKQISEADIRTQSIEKIMQYLPCLMHLENIVGIKILTMLLIEDISFFWK